MLHTAEAGRTALQAHASAPRSMRRCAATTPTPTPTSAWRGAPGCASCQTAPAPCRRRPSAPATKVGCTADQLFVPAAEALQAVMPCPTLQQACWHGCARAVHGRHRDQASCKLARRSGPVQRMSSTTLRTSLWSETDSETPPAMCSAAAPSAAGNSLQGGEGLPQPAVSPACLQPRDAGPCLSLAPRWCGPTAFSAWLRSTRYEGGTFTS